MRWSQGVWSEERIIQAMNSLQFPMGQVELRLMMI